jgi:tetratricopeptide (TPR) repeat protein
MLTEAEAETRKFLKSQSDSAQGHFLLGYILFREQKARESLAEMTEGAKHQKPSAADLRVVGVDYVLLADYGDADKWFTKATQWDPENVLGWYYLGRTKYNENRFEEAVSAFEQCLKLAPRHIRAEDNLGLSLQGLGRMDEARTAFLNAIAWQADSPEKDPWPYMDLGSFFLENNQPDQAVPHLQEAAKLVPNSPKAHQQLGKAYLALRQLDKAQQELETAVKLEPESARAHYILGQLYEKRGESQKAKEEFARYSQLNTRHPNNENSEADR